LGFTLPQIDEVLVPYAEKSYEKYKHEFYDIADNLLDYRHSDFEQKAHDYAMRKVERDMAQGYQGLEYKFNTVSSSRGDYPFITITFGLGTDSFAKMASKTFLRVHREGQGKDGNKKPVLFPKLVFLYTEELHGKGKVNEELFEEGIKTSAKTMYPDWLSLDGDTTVSKMYHKYGKVISPMGKCKSAHVKRY
jgi:ribonucleoside-triphosphate reductase